MVFACSLISCVFVVDLHVSFAFDEFFGYFDDGYGCYDVYDQYCFHASELANGCFSTFLNAYVYFSDDDDGALYVCSDDEYNDDDGYDDVYDGVLYAFDDSDDGDDDDYDCVFDDVLNELFLIYCLNFLFDFLMLLTNKRCK
jgi:hypothetical protein